MKIIFVRPKQHAARSQRRKKYLVTYVLLRMCNIRTAEREIDQQVYLRTCRVEFNQDPSCN